MCFMTISANLGAPPCSTGSEVVPFLVGRDAIDLLRQLVRQAHPDVLRMNDVEALEVMSNTSEIAYMPLVFGYSNYSRVGYRSHRLVFEGIPEAVPGVGGAILGGAGLGISASSSQAREAARYGAWLMSAQVQTGLYVDAGGQPAHVAAWTSSAADDVAGGFFSQTRSVIEQSYLRPTYSGYLSFQERLGELIHDAVLHDVDCGSVLNAANHAYRSSLGVAS
jgi:multiple sugar transport system substrate-binding protein